jgi:hypothetical protein
VLERGIAHTAENDWNTSAASLDVVLPHAVTTRRSPRSESALLELESRFGDGCLALVSLRDGRVSVRVAAAELPAVREIDAWLRSCLPAAEPTDDRELPISFWSYGRYGASETSRLLAVPSWDEIAANYPAAVRARLARIMDPSYRPGAAGQLLLWHGPPGTGKTYALRALAWEWRKWCGLHYVVDPDVLFGSRADYLVDLLLDEDHGGAGDEPRWRLLVLEDTGELLAADAKEQTGQGLSRLLNLVDGIVGQGLRLLVLVTTNEPLQRLHPAVSRPGRCAAKIEFEPFPAGEAERWLAERGGEGAPAATLASLYGRVAGAEPEPERRRIGFGL